MKSIQLWSCIHPLKIVVLYMRRGPELYCLFMSAILFFINFLVPWLFFSTLLLLQSALHPHRIKNYKTYHRNKKEELNSCKKISRNSVQLTL